MWSDRVAIPSYAQVGNHQRSIATANSSAEVVIGLSIESVGRRGLIVRGGVFLARPGPRSFVIPCRVPVF